MKLPAVLHDWDIDTQAAAAIQRELAGRIIRRGRLDKMRYVAGLDCAFPAEGRECLAAAIVWDMQDGCVVEEQHATAPTLFPYIPGFLSFREAPAILAALEKVQHRVDLLMFDGHGIAHPRRLGIASHVGLLCDMPAVACAKSRLTGVHEDPGPERGSRMQLLAKDGEELGAVLRTRDNVKPVYVSIGHKTTLDDAVNTVLRCGRGLRLPEPTRLADKRVADIKKEMAQT